MDTLTLISSFALTGLVVSTFAEFTKDFLDKQGHKTLYVIALSIIGGLGIYYAHLVPTNIVETLVGVWAAANTVYVALIKLLPEEVDFEEAPLPPQATQPDPPVPPASTL
jgi:hypothetical protein